MHVPQPDVIDAGNYWETWECPECGGIFEVVVDPYDDEVVDDDGYSLHECYDDNTDHYFDY